jgi:hypothetical protein
MIKKVIFSVLILLTPLPGFLPQARPGDPLVAPRDVSVAELRDRGFQANWEFPRYRANGTAYPGVDFEQTMFGLARKPLVPAQNGRPAIWLGDLLKEVARLGWSRKSTDQVLKQVKGKLGSKDYDRVRHLLHCSDLYGQDWNPRKSNQRHGMHFGDTWEFEKKEWSMARADREVEQIAQLVMADIAAIKEAEANYANYWNHTKHDWERIEVVPDTHMVLRDTADKRLMSTCQIDFKFDLPWPFSTAEFRMYTLNKMLDDGRPVLYLLALSEDLHWLAGYDLYEPVRDRDGNWVATMMVREFGLDIDGVPDGRGDRHDNLRGQFGNLRRDSERLFKSKNRSKAEPEIYPYKGLLPEILVRDGRRN